MITTTITHDKVNGTMARLSGSHQWLKSTLEYHGFKWSRSMQVYTLPGTRTWAFDPYRVGRLTRHLRRNGFTVKVAAVDNGTPKTDPIADALEQLLDIAYAAQRLGAALQEDNRSRPGQVTNDLMKAAQDAVEAACTKADVLAERLGDDCPDIRHAYFVLNQAWVAVGLPPF